MTNFAAIETTIDRDYIEGEGGYTDLEKHFHEAAYQAALVFLGSEKALNWYDLLINESDTQNENIQAVSLSLVDQDYDILYNVEIISDKETGQANITVDEAERQQSLWTIQDHSGRLGRTATEIKGRTLKEAIQEKMWKIVKVARWQRNGDTGSPLTFPITARTTYKPGIIAGEGGAEVEMTWFESSEDRTMIVWIGCTHAELPENFVAQYKDFESLKKGECKHWTF